ncbi:flagellar basal body P-ring formation chaperone FlgA [Roseibium sp. RKSG952]|uniref:flagellar basal body P-ring formation chaperone FlgA n=1 Tax=Roseibium sp. RKSG952 TaxID=2529384 RepID=UPI0012BC25ED|nr:flagellar basal body P-ring formation chaperone FlgA [Roseibium sp. RKSG952]MTH97622.1 flagellar basal body P-ring formation protein FlgA [Roseibium sp. RKSG952]
MRRLLTLAGMVFLALAQPAAATDTPILRAEVRTFAEIVTVGDFYANAGTSADVPLFRAPDMGTSGKVPADVVARRALAAGLTGAGTNGLREVEVRRLAETYDAERLKDFIRKTLAGRDASIQQDNLDVSFYRPPSTIHVDPKADEPLKASRVLWSRNDGRFDIYLSVHDQHGEDLVNLRGIAREVVEVAALAQPLRRGQIVKAEDLTSVRMARSQVPARALTDATELVGLAARNALRANAPLSRQDFERPVLIARGDKLTVTYFMPGMKLTTRGQAMEDGAEGDTIDVMNLQSRRIVPAIVLSRGQVRVQLNAPVVASLNQGIN